MDIPHLEQMTQDSFVATLKRHSTGFARYQPSLCYTKRIGHKLVSNPSLSDAGIKSCMKAVLNLPLVN